MDNNSYYPYKICHDSVHYRLRHDKVVEGMSLFGGANGAWREIKDKFIASRLMALNPQRKVTNDRGRKTF